MSHSSAFEDPPIVTLAGFTENPFDLSIAAARTCYSSKGIIAVEEIGRDEKSRQLGDQIARSTLEAGHLTTRQHAHFTFAIDKVSRHFLWSFLHSHPFYNSEQVSQRYVRVSPGHIAIPHLKEGDRKIYTDAIEMQTKSYEKLIEILLPLVQAEWRATFPQRVKTEEKYRQTHLKRAYEIARYVLPIGTHAYLYHTVSALTLLRYRSLAQSFDTPTETREVVEQMIRLVMARDPHFEKELSDPLPLESTPEYRAFTSFTSERVSKHWVRDFDQALGNYSSKLIDWKANTEETLATAVRNTLGVSRDTLNNASAIALILDPEKNPLLAHSSNPGSLSKLMRAMSHVHYTFSKKISHTADSQNERHRLTPASRPILEGHFTGEPDYITPPLIEKSEAASALYHQTMRETWRAANQLLDHGVSFEWASYLLPNALAIRFEESGDLTGFHHKWKVRSCYTAQEEIFRATIEELNQVSAIHPEIAKHILAPCYLRHQSGTKPYCPEGPRYCGVPVWRQSIEEYKRIL